MGTMKATERKSTTLMQRRPRPVFRLASLLLLLLGALMLALPQPRAADRSVVVLDIYGPIGPAIKDYMIRGIERAEDEGAAMVVLRMDTPGGLDASMRDMISKILNARVPVATWVGPPGARAASAGTFILYASHVAAMAPSTNLGAASPVQIGGGGGSEEQAPRRQRTPIERIMDAMAPDAEDAEGEETADSNGADPDEATAAEDEAAEPPPLRGTASERKVMEDAVAYIRGLAERHGRNADWAERAVREAVSLTATEALEMNVIDLVAETLEDLLVQAHGREVKLGDTLVTLDLEGARVEIIEQDWRSRFLGVITNPTLAFMLLMIGIYGLILEGSNPGALVPGTIGGISLLLALYAFQVLPVNVAGLALMILGFLLIAVELFVPSFGILGIGGMAAVVFGSIILFDSDVPGFVVNTGLIAAMGLFSALTFAAVIYLVTRSHRNPRVTGTESLVGREAESISDFSNGRGRVHIEGEDWSARGDDSIRVGDLVTIEASDGLILQVRPGAPQH
jgi:membrane-bound serine protease (ClpP class)